MRSSLGILLVGWPKSTLNCGETTFQLPREGHLPEQALP